MNKILYFKHIATGIFLFISAISNHPVICPYRVQEKKNKEVEKV